MDIFLVEIMTDWKSISLIENKGNRKSAYSLSY